MNKQEYLEANRELIKEAEIKKEKSWDALLFALQIAVLISTYTAYFISPEVREGLPDYIILLTGGVTVLIIWEISDLINNKKQKEVKHGRTRKH
jgi:hypothetical protein